MSPPNGGSDGDAPDGEQGQDPPARQQGPAISAAPDDDGTGNTQLWGWGKKKTKDVRIAQHGSVSWKKISDADGKSKTHHVESNTWWAKKSEVVEAMQKVERGDIFTSDLHTGFPESEKTKVRPKASGIMGDGWIWDDLITIKEIVAALKVGTPPSAVVMMGCDTSQILPSVIGAGVAAAYGIGPEDEEVAIRPFVAAANCSSAADAVTGALMMGETLEKAAALGTAAMSMSIIGQTPVKVILLVRDDIDTSLSLKGNGLC